jgi:carbamoyl-phosphate synthase large subunit
VRPVFKRIDTCAAEFASPTAYMYSTYEAPFAGHVADESAPSDKNKVIILGGGPNRIGQGIEFDYCCCHACFALHDAGFETIMINCNPETVSTDYDTADRLYFEPLTAEDVLEIIDTERKNGTLHGVIVQFGGQTPLKLARALEAAEVPILGTSPDAIDLAEDRDRFKRVLDKLRLKQPKNGIAYSVEQARLVAADLGLPLVVRPSYVLGGRAMQTICSAPCPSWCRATSRRAIPTTRPARSTPCWAPIRCCSTAISPTPPRSTSIAFPTARTLLLSASWSTSRKRVSIRAIPPVRCRRIRSTP